MLWLHFVMPPICFSKLPSKVFSVPERCWLVDICGSDSCSLPLTATDDDGDLEEVPGCCWRDYHVLLCFIFTGCTFTVKALTKKKWHWRLLSISLFTSKKGLANCVVQTSFGRSLVKPHSLSLWNLAKQCMRQQEAWGCNLARLAETSLIGPLLLLIEVFLSHIF